MSRAAPQLPDAPGVGVCLPRTPGGRANPVLSEEMTMPRSPDEHSLATERAPRDPDHLRRFKATLTADDPWGDSAPQLIDSTFNIRELCVGVAPRANVSSRRVGSGSEALTLAPRLEVVAQES